MLATGLLAPLHEPGAPPRRQVPEAGAATISAAARRNRQARSPHEALVAQVAHELARGGRIAWRGQGRLNEPGKPARPAPTHALVVANARHSRGYGCALRLDCARSGRLIDHAGFIHTFLRVALPVTPEYAPKLPLAGSLLAQSATDTEANQVR